jgi:hypothetical protein
MVSPAPRTSVLNKCRPFVVIVGQRLAIVAAGYAGPDLRHLHEAVPQPVPFSPRAAIFVNLGIRISGFQFDFDKTHWRVASIGH